MRISDWSSDVCSSDLRDAGRMTSLSASPQMIALVPAAMTLPIMLLSLWAGAVADNSDRRLVMLACQLFMLVVSALLALFAWMRWVTPWALLGFTFLVGCATAINGPAWQAGEVGRATSDIQ